MPMLEKNDPQLALSIQKEWRRQNSHLELIASENFVSADVLEAQGSILTNKYAEGYPGQRYYAGCAYVDEVEALAIQRARTLFGCAFANVQPHSGSQANQAVFLAFLKPGDCILSMSLDAGGHLSHGAKVNIAGKWFSIIHYGVHPETHVIDPQEIRRLALAHRPRLIIAGASAYPKIIDFKMFREIADEVGALLMADIAHIAGPVAAGLHPHPFPHAHIVTSTTHKTLRGPRGGLILSQDPAHAQKIDHAIFPGLQGGPLMHVIAAKAVCFQEALSPSFKFYMQAVLENAKALAHRLQQKGFTLVAGGTENHLLLIDLRSQDISGREAESLLGMAGLTCNKNGIPGDHRPPKETSGLRLGSPACTTRGLGKEDFQKIGDWIAQCLLEKRPPEDIAKEVTDLCLNHPLPTPFLS
jgi:glycine hydroxymethyltransferase